MKTAQGQLVIERFWNHVQKGRDSAACWIWTGGQSMGYGTLYHSGRRRKVRAHQFSYEVYVGPVHHGLDIVHTCHNKLCVNPGHLVPMTRAQMRRFQKKVSQVRG